MVKHASKLLFLSALILVVLLTACASQSVPSAATQAAPASGAAVSFAKDVLPIFQTSCVGCHGSGGRAGLDLSSYASVMAGSSNGAVVIAGDANNSLLVGKVSSGMMPKGGSKLSNDQIQKIKEWINAGAQNN
jgi:cytochrome c553